jgi:magnesium-protoporphyrin O-methyltransferase
MMPTITYIERRRELETYFDRTAVEAWSRLTSTAPVGRIRATVRAGRDRMRETLLTWLPDDLHGRRILDAGCGTGALALELARRGADVVAVDLSPNLIALARERSATEALSGSVSFQAGDMLLPRLGRFDHIVAMDSLIHYDAPDAVRVLGGLFARTQKSLLFTFAPRTPMLAAMHAVGRLFPKSDRAPSLEPLAESDLRGQMAKSKHFDAGSLGRGERIVSGFYTSQAMELCRS